MQEPWWKNAIGYQVYPRSFKDSNGDGIGDIKGIIEKLPYLKSLGIDFIWLNPIYKSPNVDNGYDISDYEGIQPEFGTMSDFDELLKQAHSNGIKIILDLVVNHTSDQHPWFIQSKKSKDNPYRDYYMWADATPDKMPNDWTSFSGNSTWTYDETTKQAFFHVFAPQQPDLNWRNPKMRKEIYKMIRWWLDLGIDGFRMDAISHIQKEPWDYDPKDDPWSAFMNVKGIDNYMSEMRDIFDQYNIMTVGEASGVTSKQAPDWTDPNKKGYVNMIFELEHNVRAGEPGKERIDVLGMKKVLSRWQKDQETSGWNALYFENHDNPRINTILGNETTKSATAIAMSYFFLKGTPFIYQGQELGMTNYPFTSIDQVDDDESKLRYNDLLKKGKDPIQVLNEITHWTRDHSRTPMQWTNDSKAGFTTGSPWMKVNPNTATINVAVEEDDKASVLNFYRRMIEFRKSELTFINGSYIPIFEDDKDVFAYIRKYGQKEFVIITNLSKNVRKMKLPDQLLDKNWNLKLSNNKISELKDELELAPFDGMVFEKE
ncbi:alpha-glucosidase [Companilactobacillus allii]|uniref:Alpha-amylase n=1 Tax=Companilactobacillus allii TaxID=1847728 RepID=A0A1P8Q4J6_9LACO|nr:alpha-glucosidase [Companilactobacillus allii]APX72755.1 glucohydrolase [Companilactobacillus allii]USQ67542.1 alpha-glucosidase [Companilactobacillus allii]